MDCPSIEPKQRVLLTGGIGSGKSTVAARMRELGAEVIEADLIGHDVLEPEGAAFQAVAERWPGVIADGLVNRSELAEIVFDDETALQELEEITHPAIGREIAKRIASSNRDIVVVEVPVEPTFLDGDWTRIAVTAPLEIRVARAVSRGSKEESVRRRVSVQLEDDDWVANADYVVVNDGGRGDLLRSVDDLWGDLVEGS